MLFKDRYKLIPGVVKAHRLITDIDIGKQVPDASRITPCNIFCGDVMPTFQNPLANSLRRKGGARDIKIEQRNEPPGFPPFYDARQIRAAGKRGFKSEILPFDDFLFQRI